MAEVASMEGPWSPLSEVCQGFSGEQRPEVDTNEEADSLSFAKGKPPTIFYSNKPAEVILSRATSLRNIPATQLSFATNTGADLFVYAPTKQFYYLVAAVVQISRTPGTVTYATPDLPADFANIPGTAQLLECSYQFPGRRRRKTRASGADSNHRSSLNRRPRSR